MLHPRSRTLSLFVDGELPPARVPRVAAHLARCTRCRDVVWGFRAIDAAALETRTPPLPDGLLEHTLARRASGEDVILPAAESVTVQAAQARGARWRRVAVAVTVALGATAVLWLSSDTLEAEASDLQIEPAQPRAGATVSVEYHATSRLSDQRVLVLRARLRASGDDPELRAVARLERVAGRNYHGAFTLPDSVTYAVFAVEDTAAQEVDAGGEAWELLVHGDDGQPLLGALLQKYFDLRRRNTVRAAEVAAGMTSRYPYAPRTWHPRFISETSTASESERDSISAAHRARLPSLLSHADSTRLEDLVQVVFYAGGIGDTATARVWRAALLRRFPNSREARQQRVFLASAETRGDPAAFFATAERLWQGDPRTQAQLAFSAFQRAQVGGDVEQLRRWGPRVLATGALDRSFIIPAFMRSPVLRPEGMDHVRAYVRELDGWGDDRRALTQTAAGFRAMIRSAAATHLAQLGQALVDAGDVRAALDTLDIAAEAAWSPHVFRSIAETRIVMGDTAGALPLLARVAADPLTPAGFADSVAASLPRHFDATRWSGWTEAGVKTMVTHLMRGATNRAVKADLRLRDTAGTTHRFAPAGATETFIAVWSRHCPPSLMQLGELNALVRELSGRGVRIITIAEESPSASLHEFMTQRKLSFAYYYDTDRDARRLLDAMGTPTYLVLDRDGQIRFESHALTDVVRQVWMLQRARSAT